MFRSYLKTQFRSINTYSFLMKPDDKRQMLKSMPKKDEGVLGEKSIDIDLAGISKQCEFPEIETEDRLYNETPFKMLPIVHIKATKNNTLFQLTTHQGMPLYNRSCGVDGFKNCRKGTNIAAQVTATAFGKFILKMGYQTVRVCVNGLGPGRMSSFKGLQLAQLNIVSITDTTPTFDPPLQRPRAAKSL